MWSHSLRARKCTFAKQQSPCLWVETVSLLINEHLCTAYYQKSLANSQTGARTTMLSKISPADLPRTRAALATFPVQISQANGLLRLVLCAGVARGSGMNATIGRQIHRMIHLDSYTELHALLLEYTARELVLFRWSRDSHVAPHDGHPKASR